MSSMDAEFVRTDGADFTVVDSAKNFRKDRVQPPATERVNMTEWLRIIDEERAVDEKIIEARIEARIAEKIVIS